MSMVRKIIVFFGLPEESAREHERLLARFTRSHSWLLTSNILHLVIGLALFPLKTRLLGAEAYGVLSLIVSTPLFISAFIFLGLNTSIAKYVSDFKGQGRPLEISRMVNIMLIYYAGAVLVAGAVSAPVLLRATGRTDLLKYYFFLLATILLQNLFAMFARGLKRFRVIAFYPLITHLLSLAIILTLYFTGRIGLAEFLLADCLANLVSCIVLVACSLDVISLRARPEFALFRRMLVFSLPLVMSLMYSRLILAGSKYILAFMVDMDAVGLFTAASRIGEMVRVPISPLTLVLLPTMLGLFQEKKTGQIRVLSGFLRKGLVYYGGYTVAMLLLYSEPFLELMTGYQFDGSGRVMTVVGLSFVIFSLQYIYSSAMVVHGHTKTIGFHSLLAAVAYIVMAIGFTAVWGMIGVALGMLGSMLLLFILNYRFVCQRYDSMVGAIRAGDVACSAAAAVLTVVLSRLWPEGSVSDLGTFVLGGLGTTVIYAVIAVALLRIGARLKKSV